MKTVVVFLVTVFAVLASPPSYIKPCKFSEPGFNKCALKNGNYAIPFIIRGDRSRNIPLMNPLTVPLIDIIEDKFRLELHDLKIYGLDKGHLSDIKINKTYADLTIYSDNLQFIGKYKMRGKILFLGLEGEGPANVTAVNGYYRFISTLETYVEDNKKYIKYNKPVMEYKLKRAFFKFDNIFGGQGIDLNKILNDNYEDVLMDIDRPLKETVTTLVESIVSEIIKKLPESYVFPE